MKRILWISRHDPKPCQIKELKEAFGEDLKIIVQYKRIEYATDVLQMMEEFFADEVVVVLPMWMIEQLVKLGVRPIKAVMARELHDKGAKFHHRYFIRIEDVAIKTKKII